MASLVQSILCFALVYFAQGLVVPQQNPLTNYFPNDFPGNMGGPLLGSNGISGGGTVDRGSNGINGEGNTIGSPSSNAVVGFSALVNGTNTQQTSSSGSSGSDSSSSSGSSGGSSGGSSSKRKRSSGYLTDPASANYLNGQPSANYLNGQQIYSGSNAGLIPNYLLNPGSNGINGAGTVDEGSNGINGANNHIGSPEANAAVSFQAAVSGSNNQTTSSGGSSSKRKRSVGYLTDPASANYLNGQPIYSGNGLIPNYLPNAVPTDGQNAGATVDNGSNGINGYGNTIGSPESNAAVAFNAAVVGSNTQTQDSGSSSSKR